MESFGLNNNEQSGIFSKLKRSISMMLMAGALTACDNNAETGQKDSGASHPDRFDKASATIDANLQEGKKVVEQARKMGVEIPEGVSFSYVKEEGKVVSITVGGKEVPFEMSLADEVKPEVKTSSDSKDFIEATSEAKSSQPSSGEIKTNPDIKNF